MEEGAPNPGPDPVNLKFLRVLVTVLTGTMIAGLLVIIGLIVIKFSDLGAPMALPEAIILPDGSSAAAFTMGKDWYAVVTDNDEILIFGKDSGALRQTIRVGN